MEGKGTEKRPEMFMIYRNVIAATIVVTVCILAGSNAMAQRHGGFSGGGFRGGFNGHGFRGDRFRHRDFGDRFVFFGDFGDPSSFTIPIHITGTIPTDIILTITDIIPTPNLFTKAVPNIPTL